MTGPALHALPPDSVTVNGTRYALNTGHRTALRALAALEDGRLAVFEQQAVLLRLLYKGAVPPAGDGALRAAVWFLNCGREDPAPEGPRVYSFSHDGPLIYAAMQKSCGVDVWGPELHWWRFAALLADIGEDTLFARVVYLRRQRALGRLTPAERRAAAALGPLLELPGAGAPRGEEAAFFDRLRKGERAT